MVLALSSQATVTRIRVAWNCDGASLLLDVRDDGRGEADVADIERQLRARIDTLGGTIDAESTEGWGSRVTAALPLDTPAPTPGRHTLSSLGPREFEVLEHLVAGQRNRAIAEKLGVSESTVNFHVASLLKKLDVGTRGEAAAAGTGAGVKAAR